VFSPYYAWARKRGDADPHDHCALNVALYGARSRWTMTERGQAALERGPAHLAIGPSALDWNGDTLSVRIDEVAVPLPSRVRGTVRVHPRALPARTFALDAGGRHRWSPIAPIARVEVDLSSPALRWSGAGYLDMNAGDAPLERDFARWTWSCARVAGDAAVLYDVTPRAGEPRALALRFNGRGEVEDFPPPPETALPRTFWRMPRATRSEAPARLRQTLEDAPFYARSLIGSRLLGQDVVSVHESLALDRFATPLVQAMLPFRMPRRRS
jgi:carotenoid 1,2-hydratase